MNSYIHTYLHTYIHVRFPTVHAEINAYLGRAYSARRKGKLLNNIEKGIKYYEKAAELNSGLVGAIANNNAGCLVMKLQTAREYV
jgi:hypothetical protein